MHNEHAFYGMKNTKIISYMAKSNLFCMKCASWDKSFMNMVSAAIMDHFTEFHKADVMPSYHTTVICLDRTVWAHEDADKIDFNNKDLGVQYLNRLIISAKHFTDLSGSVQC